MNLLFISPIAPSTTNIPSLSTGFCTSSLRPAQKRYMNVNNKRKIRHQNVSMTVSSSSSTPPEKTEPLTYASSGVNIDEEAESVKALISTLKGAGIRKMGTPGALVKNEGGFSGMIEFGDNYLALCTDGVGSKLLLASTLQSYNTVGIDCIAMNVNDLICIGAEPLAFVDYIASPKPNKEIWKQIGEGLRKGCELSKTSLCGGETASLPGMLNHIDMNGTALGYVKRGNEIDGQNLKVDDAIIGLPSNGIHSNGYSLVRKVIDQHNIQLDDVPQFNYQVKNQRESIEKQYVHSNNDFVSIGDILMNPTMIYVNPVIDLLKSCLDSNAPCEYHDIHGIFHITGGGLSNLLRLNSNFGFEIDDPINVLPEFDWIRKLGNVSDFEMYRTFNMGMGMCIIVDPSVAADVNKWLNERLAGCKVVGKVTNEKEVVKHLPTGITYDKY